MQDVPIQHEGPTLAAWRRTCAHVSGGAMGSTIAVLERHGALERLARATAPLDVATLARDANLVASYAHLAALILATQGLAVMTRTSEGTTTVALSDEGRAWARHAAAYDGFERVLDDALALRAALAGDGAAPDVTRPGGSPRAADALAASPPALAERLRRHLRGPLVAAAVRGLASVRGFGRIARAPLGWCPLDALGLPRPALDAAVAVLAEEGWLAREDDLVHVTPEGLAGARCFGLYGYLVGYLGVLRQVPALLGREHAPDADPTVIKTDEDRALLLAGKAEVFERGGLRGPMEDMVRAVFDRAPLDAQPRLLLDMSAGDGSVLARLLEVIRTSTRRGAALDEHPLALVGLVGNRVARERSGERLAAAGVDALLLEMPLEDPDALAAELARAGLDLRDALVVSKTCIHGRRFTGTNGARIAPRSGAPSQAVQITPEGELVAPEVLEDDLAAFFARWARWIARHGMIAADTHTVAPEVAARSWPVNVVTHVLATHGYSAQYLVEAEVFRRAASRGGLVSRASRDLGTELVGATTMTLDHFVVAGSTDA